MRAAMNLAEKTLNHQWAGNLARRSGSARVLVNLAATQVATMEIGSSSPGERQGSGSSRGLVASICLLDFLI